MRQAAILVLTVVGAAASLANAARPQSAGPFQPADYQFFEKKVRPLLVEHCFGCHSAQAKKLRGELRLDSRAAILKGGESGPVVVPRQPDKSLLIEAVRYQSEALQMPPKGKLPDRAIAIFEEWVRRGLPFPDSADPVLAKKSVGLEQGRKFWSFQPPRPSAPPAIRDRDWPRGRLDAFVLAELEKRGLSPSSPAARRTLIRRATFDLIGLPPTLTEVEAFCKDGAPDAYERLVERLLASPLYGERWGRFWLDLARYCDIAEPWLGSKGQPWLYRDWVVQAFNEDLPYNQFVIRQLAADHLPDARPRDRAALGFLGLSPTYWKELKLDKDVIKTVVAEEWEERIDAVARTFLGLSVACARCHDHKFDPISTQDYYALAGVLASTRQTDRTILPDALDLPVRRAHQRVQALQDQITKLQVKMPVPAPAAKEIAKLKAQIQHTKKTTPHYDAPLAPAVEDASLHVLADGPDRTKIEYQPGVAQDVCIQVRGNPAKAGAVVSRRFLAVLSPVPPRPFKQGSGRLELAQAIVNEGAPLSARVIVNRVWKHHFGAGLVETPSDFGAQGARPSHPALLDDLTARFIANGWSLKWLHREIMRSAAYRQSSRHDRRKHAIDPDNRWLGRMNRRRLEIEAWRDAMLAVTGTLRLERGGPPLDLGSPLNRRRTVCGTIKRRELADMLRLYDVPDATLHNPSRMPTTTPLQQLFVLNSPFMEQQAAALEARLQAEAPGDVGTRIRRAYQLLYQRPPTGEQMKLGLEFLQTAAGDRSALWQQYAQVLLGSNEFLYVD